MKFYILGHGPLQARLERVVQSTGLNYSVIFDHLDDPSSIVNRSMVHVCIVDYDNSTNQSLLEGMASGCAIVASDVGETQSIVTPNVEMLVSLEPRVVAYAVSHLLAHPELCNKVGRAARRKAETNHHVNGNLEYLTRPHRF
ncbi:MAG: glycosyltransferase [Chloroflexi bacterium]|nr:glycosyltransferase [Chloroflexota bacterium]